MSANYFKVDFLLYVEVEQQDLSLVARWPSQSSLLSLDLRGFYNNFLEYILQQRQQLFVSCSFD